MPRPNGTQQYPDFVDAIDLAGGFTTSQKLPLSKVFHRLAGRSIIAADVTATSNTTFADVPGMSWNLRKGARYRIRGTLLTAANAAGGVKVALAGTGLTSPIVTIAADGTQAAAVTAQRSTALGSVFAATADVIKIELDGFIQADARGRLALQFAQNASNAAASTLYRGSWLQLLRIG